MVVKAASWTKWPCCMGNFLNFPAESEYVNILRINFSQTKVKLADTLHNLNNHLFWDVYDDEYIDVSVYFNIAPKFQLHALHTHSQCWLSLLKFSVVLLNLSKIPGQQPDKNGPWFTTYLLLSPFYDTTTKFCHLPSSLLL